MKKTNRKLLRDLEIVEHGLKCKLATAQARAAKIQHRIDAVKLTREMVNAALPPTTP